MRQNSRIIIITGGIATGKSTVSSYLKEKGYTVLDSDQIVRDLYKQGTDVYFNIIEMFGEIILNSDGEIDRVKLKSKLFESDKNRAAINKIVHSALMTAVNTIIDKITDKVIFLDIPLAIEEMENLTKYGLIYDELWLVYTNRKTQLDRLLKRDKRGLEESQKFIDSQMDIDEKKQFADEVIYNDKTVSELKQQVDALLLLKI